MDPQSTFPMAVLYSTAIISLGVSLYARRWRTAPGGYYFILLMAAVAIFAFTNAVELSVVSMADKITWSKLSYIGVVSVSPLYLLFAAGYSQHNTWLTRYRSAAIWIFPALILGLAATNEWHGWIWPNITPISQAMGARLIYEHGIGVLAFAVYAYTLIFIGSFWLISAARMSPHLFRRQYVLLVIGALVPWLGNLLYLLQLNPWPGIDLTPIALSISGILYGWTLFRSQMFDLSPVARDILFESIGDSVIVLNQDDRIIDLNPVARRWLAVDDRIIGKNIYQVTGINESMLAFKAGSTHPAELVIAENGKKNTFDLTISPLRSARGLLQGRVIVLHNISRERALLDVEQHHVRQMEMLNAITHATLTTLNLEQLLQILAESLGKLFEADDAFLTLWDAEKERGIPAAANGPFRDIFSDFKAMPGELTMTESVLRAGHVLVVEDIAHTTYMAPRIARDFATRSLMALPLIANSQKLGAVLIGYDTIHHFAEDEIALGEQAAGQVALAIAKVQLYENVRQHSAQLEALQSISQVVASSLDLKKIFETIVKVLQVAFGYRYISIYSLEGEKLLLEAQAGYSEETIFKELTITRGILGRTVRTRRPQFVRNVADDADFLRATSEVESEICIPLLKEQTVLGTLNVESTAQLALTETDLNLLITFGNQVVAAIANAQLYVEIQRLAIQDELTGLYNRRGFFEIGRHEFERAVRFKRPLCVLFMDVDEFKAFNNVYSYAVGDQVLRSLGYCLKERSREVDLIGRYGGDEFVILLPETDLEHAVVAAERLRQLVESVRVPAGELAVGFTVSIGVCQHTPDLASLEELIDSGGKALQEAKRMGRNRVATHSPIPPTPFTWAPCPGAGPEGRRSL
jgi:diguanylate cyclase (GGDEF)-like protein